LVQGSTPDAAPSGVVIVLSRLSPS
jgi:hypothetical protein